ncbi:unnamed protein product [Lactuca saligna]|uniref:SWIM-type domain-containing protein n=1 Tax=Lactuca saligna TaxID=75948 RepID=A0AA36DXC4_LACSI|nr:unnamed protein product [Lactuca saligna]
MTPWRIRATMDEIDVARRYAGHPTIFSVRLHHGGQFTKFPGRKYIKGKQNYVDLLDIDTFSIHDIDEMMEELGHIDSDETLLYYHFLRPFGDLDFGLFALGQDVHHLGTYVANHKVIDVYIEHGKTNLHTYYMSPNPSKVKIVEIKEPPACSKQLFLEWNDSPIEHESVPDLTEVENDSHFDKEPSLVDHIEFEMNVENEDDYDGSGHNNGSGNDEFDDDSESEDSDFFIDEDNLIHDVDVDMKDFHMNIDKDVEWVGGSSESNVPEDTQQGDLEVINTEVLLSGSSSDEANDGKRRKTIRAIHRAYENDATLVSEPFYIFQTFSSSKDFKTQVKLHSIRTRREIQLEKNDKNRVRFVCKGTIPNLATNEEEKCPWVIYCRRAHCDALTNNLCEAFNSKIEDGRDAPIINCIEFIREYIMKKIVKVDKEIQKVVGPLTPTATTILDNIKSKAEQYVATFCGAGKYQVAGPWQDQCIVDVGQQSCTCKRWELTGIPCKHGVAAIWDMGRNDKDVGIPESFVHPCYWLSSWKEMYSFKVSPINGRSMWEKSAIPTTLLPPKHRVPIGRPKKKRTISIVEKEDFVRGNTASRAHRSVTCTKCNNVGHNARTCKGQRPIVGGGGGQSQVKGKGKGKATT